MSRSSALTEHDVLALRPCAKYTRGRVRELWAARVRLGPEEINALPIPAADRLWCLVRMAPREAWLPEIYRAVERAIRNAATALDSAATALGSTGLPAEAESLRQHSRRLCDCEPVTGSADAAAADEREQINRNVVAAILTYNAVQQPEEAK